MREIRFAFAFDFDISFLIVTLKRENERGTRRTKEKTWGMSGNGKGRRE